MVGATPGSSYFVKSENDTYILNARINVSVHQFLYH